MKTRRITAAIAVAALLFLGSGCTGGDFATVYDFLSEWSHAQGLTDADGKPTAKAAKVALWGSGDSMVDAAVDAGVATSGVRAADKAMAEADEALRSKNPDYKKAEEELDVAAKARPNDWAVLNRQWALDVEQGRAGQAAEEKKRRADEAACKTDPCRASMLEDRLKVLGESNVRLAGSGASQERKCVVMKEERNTNVSLGQHYEYMGFKITGIGQETERRKNRYADLANHYLSEADDLNRDLKALCGGVY